MSDLFDDMTEEESILFQLDNWVKGISLHNTLRDECCPDFSCCGSPILDEKTRKTFLKAYQDGNLEIMLSIMGMGLQNLASEIGIRLCVLDGSELEEH